MQSLRQPRLAIASRQITTGRTLKPKSYQRGK
jgi:hypothetical protein